MIYAYVAVALFMSVSLVGMDIHGDLSVILPIIPLEKESR